MQPRPAGRRSPRGGRRRRRRGGRVGGRHTGRTGVGRGCRVGSGGARLRRAGVRRAGVRGAGLRGAGGAGCGGRRRVVWRAPGGGAARAGPRRTIGYGERLVESPGANRGRDRGSGLVGRITVRRGLGAAGAHRRWARLGGVVRRRLGDRTRIARTGIDGVGRDGVGIDRGVGQGLGCDGWCEGEGAGRELGGERGREDEGTSHGVPPGGRSRPGERGQGGTVPGR